MVKVEPLPDSSMADDYVAMVARVREDAFSMSVSAQKLLQAARNAPPDEWDGFYRLTKDLGDGFKADALLALSDLAEGWRLDSWAALFRRCSSVPCFPFRLEGGHLGVYSWAWFLASEPVKGVPALHHLPTALFKVLYVPAENWAVGAADPKPGKWYTRMVVALADLHDALARTPGDSP